MLFRQAGIRHTDYAADRMLFPIPADRIAIAALLALALLAPLLFSSLTVSSYLTPWLVWVSATLGLNLILGWAGQFHFGYAAVMGIGAYTAVHAYKAGVPWEMAVVLGGSMSMAIGVVFAFAALRVKGL
jgi:branched-chain amino acid transport system permease protein